MRVKPRWQVAQRNCFIAHWEEEEMKLSQDGAARPESGVKLDIRASEGSMMARIRLCKAAILTRYW